MDDPIPLDASVEVIVKQETTGDLEERLTLATPPRFHEGQNRQDTSSATGRCLICNKLEDVFRAKQRIFDYFQNSSGHAENVIAEQIWPIYILKLLQLPTEKYSKFLTKTCLNPGDWFITCDGCDILAQNAYKLECHLKKIEKQFQVVSRKLVEKLIKSFIDATDESNSSTPLYLNARQYLRSYFQRVLINVDNDGYPMHSHPLSPQINMDNEGSDTDNNSIQSSPSPPLAIATENIKRHLKSTITGKRRGPREKSIFAKSKTGYKCLLCPFSTTKNRVNSYHTSLHKTSSFVCEFCNFPFSSEAVLNRHKVKHKHHQVDPINRRHCDEQISDTVPESLQSFPSEHLDSNGDKQNPPLSPETNTNEENPGDKGTKIAAAPLSLFPHKKRKRKLRPTKTGKRRERGPNANIFTTEAGIRKCLLCPFTTSKDRVKSYHTKMHRFCTILCELCNFPVKNDKMLYQHKVKMHQAPKIETEKKPLKCEKCNYESTYPWEIRSHMINYHQRMEGVNVDTERGIYTCKICTQAFDNERQILTHVNKYHKTELGLNTYQCQHCGKYYAEERRLQKHINFTHTSPDQPSKCDQCGATFRLPKYLEEHIERLHTNPSERVSHICDICGLDFLTRSGLIKHKKKTHLMGVPKVSLKQDLEEASTTPKESQINVGDSNTVSQCSKCGLDFVNKRARILHMIKMHSEMFKHKCNLCSNSYMSSRSLVHHQKCVHLKEKVKCDQCGDELFHRGLKSHKLNHCTHTLKSKATNQVNFLNDIKQML